ncbi:MAG: YceI family protein [Steroidobacteraceae bacterium]
MTRQIRITDAIALLGLSLLALASAAADAPGTIDVATSTIVATFKQEGVPVEAAFTRFTGHIVYDAKNVAAASASADIVTGSLDLGDEAYNAEVRKKGWFDSATYPKATFRTTSIEGVNAVRFTATGPLTIKGRALVMTVPVTVSTTPAGTAFDGVFTVSRRAFGIGDAMWDDVIEDKVEVRFHLVDSAK